MPAVLVVDDSPVDRALAGGLLSKDSDLQLLYAAHGADALSKMEHTLPDLVVTDLMMPEMDGFELVTEAKHRFPLVPFVLMTSQGSEEIAVKALREGAASYVPKSALGRELLDTVRSVLAVSGQQRSQAKLLSCLHKCHSVFELDNDCTLIPRLVAYLLENVTHMGVCDEADRVRVGVALEEALTNALYHGNLEVGSELRESDYEAYYALVEDRRRSEPYRSRFIYVDARLTHEQAVYVVRDQGPGFDPTALPDPTDPANLEKVSGRGVLLMRTFMDDVEFNEFGNEVTMVKRARTVDVPLEVDGNGS